MGEGRSTYSDHGPYHFFALICRYTNQPILGEVYEGWDSMIESVRNIILQSECLEYETSSEALFTTIQDILVSRWDKNCTPLDCLAHSLNPKYYSHEWLNGGLSHRFPPHMDVKSHWGGKMLSGGFFRIEHPLMRWRMPLQSFPLALVDLQDMI